MKYIKKCYNFLCKSVKNDKVIDLVEYLEERGIKVYSPRSEMFFARQEIKEALGCIMLCFPEYLVALRNRMFKFNYEELYEYFEKECITKKEVNLMKDKGTLSPLESSLDTAEKVALEDNKRYTHEELFSKLREKINQENSAIVP